MSARPVTPLTELLLPSNQSRGNAPPSAEAEAGAASRARHFEQALLSTSSSTTLPVTARAERPEPAARRDPRPADRTRRPARPERSAVERSTAERPAGADDRADRARTSEPSDDRAVDRARPRDREDGDERVSELSDNEDRATEADGSTGTDAGGEGEGSAHSESAGDEEAAATTSTEGTGESETEAEAAPTPLTAGPNTELVDLALTGDEAAPLAGDEPTPSQAGGDQDHDGIDLVVDGAESTGPGPLDQPAPQDPEAATRAAVLGSGRPTVTTGSTGEAEPGEGEAADPLAPSARPVGPASASGAQSEESNQADPQAGGQPMGDGSSPDRTAGNGPGPTEGAEGPVVAPQDQVSAPTGEPAAARGLAVAEAATVRPGPQATTANRADGMATIAPVGAATATEGSSLSRLDPAAATGSTASTEGADGAEPLWRQVRRALGSIRTTSTGDRQLTIRLNPAELGSIMVRISTGEAGTAVALVAESAVAASQLHQERQLLVSELEESGLAGVAVDVATSDPQSQDPGTDEAGEDAEVGSFPNSTRSGSALDPSLAGDGRTLAGRRPRAGTGLVDIDL